jgi:hypothetical protein
MGNGLEKSAALDRIRTGGQGNGHTAAPALPRACLDHEYCAVHRDVAGAVQGYLALIFSAPVCGRDVYSASAITADRSLKVSMNRVMGTK